MKRTKILLFSLLSMLIIVSSCKKDDPDPINEAEVLVKHIESIVTPLTLQSFITASDLAAAMLASDPYIIDIRSAEKWTTGHIEGAVSVPYPFTAGNTILDHIKANSTAIGDRDIIVVCYSGQSAAWSTSLLRLAGYTNAKSLKFGMSSWTTVEGYDSWSAKAKDDYVTQLETASNPKGAAGELPTINTGFSKGADILEARIEAVLLEDFNTVGSTSATESFANSSNWYIINFWPEAHYNMGHIPGSIMYDPAVDPITLEKDLLTIPGASNETVVVYCYTGHGSAFLAAYMRVLGYNAKSLKFGANSMFTSTMPGTQWGNVTVVDRPVVAGK